MVVSCSGLPSAAAQKLLTSHLHRGLCLFLSDAGFAHGVRHAFLVLAVEMHLHGQHLDLLKWPAAVPCGNTCPLQPWRQLRVLILYFKVNNAPGTKQAWLAVYGTLQPH